MPEPTQVMLSVPPDSPAFAPALGAQVTLLVRAGIEHARIELNPAEMGPVAVQIALDGGGARIDFHAEVAATRQAIEASLPSLASALHDAGLTLTGGGVFQQQQRQAPNAQAAVGAGPRAGEAARGDDLAAQVAVRPLARRGLVDLVA
jgi:flagellar hook-length control protein FliK